jgi:hypothetical protein
MGLFSLRRALGWWWLFVLCDVGPFNLIRLDGFVVVWFERSIIHHFVRIVHSSQGSCSIGAKAIDVRRKGIHKDSAVMNKLHQVEGKLNDLDSSGKLGVVAQLESGFLTMDDKVITSHVNAEWVFGLIDSLQRMQVQPRVGTSGNRELVDPFMLVLIPASELQPLGRGVLNKLIHP